MLLLATSVTISGKDAATAVTLTNNASVAVTTNSNAAAGFTPEGNVAAVATATDVIVGTLLQLLLWLQLRLLLRGCNHHGLFYCGHISNANVATPLTAAGTVATVAVVATNPIAAHNGPMALASLGAADFMAATATITVAVMDAITTVAAATIATLAGSATSGFATTTTSLDLTVANVATTIASTPVCC